MDVRTPPEAGGDRGSSGSPVVAGVSLAGADGRLVAMLSRIVRRSRELQMKGQLRDRSSRSEIDLLEHQLKVERARLVLRRTSAADLDARADALTALAQEACRASDAICRGSMETKRESRRVRKRVYQTRLIARSTQASDPAGS